MRCLEHMTLKSKFKNDNNVTNHAKVTCRNWCKINNSCSSNKTSSSNRPTISSDKFKKWLDICRWSPSKTLNCRMSYNSFCKLMKFCRQSWTSAQPFMRLKRRWIVRFNDLSTMWSKLEAMESHHTINLRSLEVVESLTTNLVSQE